MPQAHFDLARILLKSTSTSLNACVLLQGFPVFWVVVGRTPPPPPRKEKKHEKKKKEKNKKRGGHVV